MMDWIDWIGIIPVSREITLPLVPLILTLTRNLSSLPRPRLHFILWARQVVLRLRHSLTLACIRH